MEILLLTALLVLSTDGDQTRTVHPGQDVTLTGPDCSGMTSVRLQRRGSDKYVDYCRDGHAIRPEHQDPSFVGRVEGLKCPMQDGNVSTTLQNVTRGDTGEYDWFCKNRTRNSSSTVYLKVTDPGTADGGTTSGNAPSGNTTSGNIPNVGAITGGTIGGIVAVLAIMVIIVLRLCGSKFRCRPSDQKSLQHVVRTAEEAVGSDHLSMDTRNTSMPVEHPEHSEGQTPSSSCLFGWRNSGHGLRCIRGVQSVSRTAVSWLPSDRQGGEEPEHSIKTS